MKQPFCMQPWDSSPEIVKKLFKEMSLMVKYGLCPGTLKGELFRVLLEQGIHGLKVSELAKSHCRSFGCVYIYIYIYHNCFLKAHILEIRSLLPPSTMIMSSMCGSRSDSIFMRFDGEGRVVGTCPWISCFYFILYL